MSVVCAAIKNGEIAIAADTQLSFGSLIVGAENLGNSSKLYVVEDNVIGVVGWNAVCSLFEYVAEEHKEIFNFSDRKNILKTLFKLHTLLKNEYFLETHEDREQPVESIQLRAIIINCHGIYEINSYREVNHYSKYWAIGSGRYYALGALHSQYETHASAKELVLSGVASACCFDDGCSLPSNVEVIKAQQENIAIAS